MPEVLYKACLFNEVQTTDVHVNLSDREYKVLFGTGPSTNKETVSPILEAASGRARDIILSMKPMKCFRCVKQATASVNSPGMGEGAFIRDLLFVPICGDTMMCEDEAFRHTERMIKAMGKLGSSKRREEVRNARNYICAYCNRVEGETGPKMKRCARCRSFYYCNQDCQTKHWHAGHKKTCQPFKEPTPPITSSAGHHTSFLVFENTQNMSMYAQQMVGHGVNINGKYVTMKVWKKWNSREKKSFMATYFSTLWQKLTVQERLAETAKMPRQCHVCNKEDRRMSPDAGVGYTRKICHTCEVKAKPLPLLTDFLK